MKAQELIDLESSHEKLKKIEKKSMKKQKKVLKNTRK